MKISAKPRTGPATKLSSDEEDGDPDRVPPAAADQVGAAAEGLAERLVLEQDLLLDELPADVLPDREGDADDRDRHQRRRRASPAAGRRPRARSAARMPRQEARKPAAPAFDQQAHEDDHDRGDDRRGDRPPERFDQVGERQVDAGAPGRVVDAALPPASRPASRLTPPTITSRGQPDRHQRPPVAAVELPRGADQLAEGARAGAARSRSTGPQRGDADEEAASSDARIDDRRDRRRPRLAPRG